MFHRGPAQPALGRPQERLSAACSCASCSCASCVLQGAARPPSLAELIFRLHSVACLSSLGPTVLFSMFSAFPDVDAKVFVCVCVCVCVCSATLPRRPLTFFGSLRQRTRARVRLNYAAPTVSFPASPNNVSRGSYDRRRTTVSRTKLPPCICTYID